MNIDERETKLGTGRQRFQKPAYAGRRHHESAQQLVSRLLEYENIGTQGNTGALDSETVRQTIAYLMRKLGIDYPEAREIALTHHAEGGAREPMQSAEPEKRPATPPPPQPAEKHCGRCGSRHHRTADCHLAGVPL